MDFTDLFSKAQSALSLIAQGRKALAQVKDSIADGRVALSTTQQDQLNTLLTEEAPETEAAYQDLKAAIAESRK
jgi:hypothetical protein